MRPIVDGLQQAYDGQMTFEYLNAADGDIGQAVFEALSLPGHPSYTIFASDGTEQFRSFGIDEEKTLIDGIDAALEEDS